MKVVFLLLPAAVFPQQSIFPLACGSPLLAEQSSAPFSPFSPPSQVGRFPFSPRLFFRWRKGVFFGRLPQLDLSDGREHRMSLFPPLLLPPDVLSLIEDGPSPHCSKQIGVVSGGGWHLSAERASLGFSTMALDLPLRFPPHFFKAL